MTFEEARAQFPVLERYAYLNAGTFGPIVAADARGDGAAPALRQGRGAAAAAWFDERTSSCVPACASGSRS